MTEKTKKEVRLLPPKPARTVVTIRGLSSLIVHYFHPEKKGAMLKKQEKKSIQKEAKDVQKEFEMALYPNPRRNGKHVFPAGGLKAACVEAAKTFMPDIDKTKARGAFFIVDDWLEIDGPEPTMRQDNVRLSGRAGVADIRIRPEFKNWKMRVELEYDENGPISLEQIINLIKTAGFYVGIGEWRPSSKKGGIHGRFEIAES